MTPSPTSPRGAACPLRREKLTPKFCEVIASTPAALDALVDKLLPTIQTLACAPGELHGVEVALREALANAILHGNRRDPAKKVTVAGYCECEPPGGLLVVVRDEGTGFDPAHGRGALPGG